MTHVYPGPCPICGAAHSACTADSGPVLVVQLPARDAQVAEVEPTPLVAEVPPLPSGQFSTKTYRGLKGKAKP